MKRLFFTNKDISEFEQRYRATMINTLSGFKSLNLIGTSDGKNSNLAIFNSVFHLGANPPLLGMVSRPDGDDQHTIKNIRSVGQYTINHITEDFYKNAHQTSARYPKGESEFKECSIEEEFIDKFNAPFVKNSPIKMGMKLIREQLIPENNTILIIGEIQHLIINESLILDDGYIDLEKAKVLCGTSLDGYHKTEKLSRLSYAKVNQPLREL